MVFVHYVLVKKITIIMLVVKALDFNNNINYVRDVKPGEIIKINENGINTLYVHPDGKLGLCLFEILYFLNENSFTDGLYIKNIRKHL